MSRILLANNNQSGRFALAGLLSSAGFDVVTARNGREAVEQFRKERFDLVIADVELPVMDGFEVASEIRRRKDVMYVPIIFTSDAYHDTADRVKALEAGGDDYFTQPVERDELVSRVKAKLRLKKIYDELAEAREGMKESEEKYRTLVETTNTGFVILDMEGRVVDANCEYVKLTGHLVLKEIVGRSVLEWTAEHDHGRLADELMQCEKCGYIRNLEIDFLNKKGHVTPVEINSSLLITESGGRIMSLCRNITQRRKVREMLAERAMLGELGADINVALTEGETLRDMLQRCCELLVRHLHAAFARIWVLSEEENILELQASAGLYTRIDGSHSRVPVGKYKIGLLAQHRRPHLTNHVIGDPQIQDQEWARREGMVAFAGYPLVIEDRLVGVLGLFSRKTLTKFTMKSLASIGNKLALGIERKKAEEALRESEHAFRCIFDFAADGIYIVGAKDMRTQTCNPIMCRMLGYSREEMSDLGVMDIHPREDLSHILELLEKVTKGEMVRIEDIPVKRKDGSIFYADIDASPITLGGKACVMGIFRDISDRKIMEERLRSTSITDMLTGVLNRRGFFTLAHKQWKLADRSRKAMSLLYIDLDGLKQINDEWGHSAGDRALIDTARILKESFRESDIIARIGGDEFAVLITELAETDMMEVITRHVYENVEKQNKEGRRSYHLSISMGVVNYDPDHPRSIDELMSQADALMYENKKRKFNRKIRDTS